TGCLPPPPSRWVRRREGTDVEIPGAVVVVTGAGSGIGAAMARRFAADGAAGLCLADLDLAAVTSLADELAGDDLRTLALQVDVGERGEVEAMIARTEDELGPIDLLCSNAGVGIGAGL